MCNYQINRKQIILGLVFSRKTLMPLPVKHVITLCTYYNKIIYINIERETYVFGDFSMTVGVGEGVLKLVFDGYSIQRYAAIVYLF